MTVSASRRPAARAVAGGAAEHRALAAAGGAAEHRALAAAGGAAEHRVLEIVIVDADHAAAQLTAELLGEHHPALRFTAFESVDDAAPALAGGAADCVLLDPSLPGADDLGQIFAAAPGVPVVVLGGADDDQVALDAVARGAQDYVVKPALSALPLWRAIDRAIERARLTVELTRRATQDGLTGLPNRALFHDRVDQAIGRSQRSGAGFAVMLIEIEDFKSINDNFGHAAGDEVLAEISRRLRSGLADGDTPCRYAGVQFAAICQATDLPLDATRIAERVHGSICGQPVAVGVLSLRIGVSIGIARGSGDEDTSTLLHRLDGAIYEAKLTGDVCVVD